MKEKELDFGDSLWVDKCSSRLFIQEMDDTDSKVDSRDMFLHGWWQLRVRIVHMRHGPFIQINRTFKTIEMVDTGTTEARQMEIELQSNSMRVPNTSNRCTLLYDFDCNSDGRSYWRCRMRRSRPVR